jgi:putative membrane protein
MVLRHGLLAVVWAFGLLFSGVGTKDSFTWFLEVAPAIVGFAALVATYKRFRLTDLVYSLILLHCLILMLGGHYTYAEVPLGFWAKDAFGLARNHYDRLGHFAQGFIPAMIAREIFLRKNIVNGAGWRYFLIVCFCLGFSAFYELIEWWTAMATGEAATAFLGTQGDVWDTQWDMFLALCGANVALITLRAWHDSQLAGLCENR